MPEEPSLRRHCLAELHLLDADVSFSLRIHVSVGHVPCQLREIMLDREQKWRQKNSRHDHVALDVEERKARCRSIIEFGLCSRSSRRICRVGVLASRTVRPCTVLLVLVLLVTVAGCW